MTWEQVKNLSGEKGKGAGFVQGSSGENVLAKKN